MLPKAQRNAPKTRLKNRTVKKHENAPKMSGKGAGKLANLDNGSRTPRARTFAGFLQTGLKKNRIFMAVFLQNGLKKNRLF